MKNNSNRLKSFLFIVFVFMTMFICVDGVKADIVMRVLFVVINSVVYAIQPILIRMEDLQ